MSNYNDMDNMGGLISSMFVFLDEVKNFTHTANSCSISLKDQSEWKKLKNQLEKISVNVSQKRSDAGTIYEVSGSINLLKSDTNIELLRKGRYILIAYTNVDQVTKVIGTNEYPLEYTLSPLTPSKHSDFFGWQLSFKGKQLIEPPIIEI